MSESIPSLIHASENSENAGRIENMDAAESIAHAEEFRGRKAARTLETELAEGHTEQQEENLIIMEKLAEKYPHAFSPDPNNGSPIRIGEKGQQYVVTRAAPGQPSVVITKEGFVSVITTKSHGAEAHGLPAEIVDNEDLSGLAAKNNTNSPVARGIRDIRHFFPKTQKGKEAAGGGHKPSVEFFPVLTGNSLRENPRVLKDAFTNVNKYHENRRPSRENINTKELLALL